ncbi:Hypothetical predicted protein [Cloeon dipterum]|uniref:Uncharacterized protein n=1 Tax=Cloeon dipterum TaxID=197152 RepID=A0A8S1DUS3_9INSE|nr:Hypothetical predicted protein [Cloeon dipterum]
MLKKLFFTQKLDRNIKECDEVIDAVGPMVKVLTAEKNKLMIQRLQIESELRKLGRDPKMVLESMGLPYSPPACSTDCTTEDEQSLVMDSPGSSNTAQSSEISSETAAGLYDEDLNLDSVNPLDLLRCDEGGNNDKEEEEEEDEDEIEDLIVAFEENEGVYIEENESADDEKGEGEEQLEDLMQNISVKGKSKAEKETQN